MWRKQNLATYRVAELARNRYHAIWAKTEPPSTLLVNFNRPGPDQRSPEEIRAAIEAAEKQTRELGDDELQLVEMREVTTWHLLEELSVLDRLDSMIDRCIKRLLMVRGLKSISLSTSTAPTAPRKRLSAA
jgi:hypothetical protein